MRPPSSRRPRLAFADFDGPLWTAGGHYLRNLFAGLRALEGERSPEITLLSSSTAGELASLIDRMLRPPDLPYAAQLRQRVARKAPGALRGLIEPRPPLERMLRAEGVDVLFSLDSYGPRFELPLAVWIPDLQHLRMPEMFTPHELEQRSQQLQRVTSQAGRIILSSESVRADLQRFVPQLAPKARVAPFVAQVQEAVYAGDPAAICDRYGLPRRYFFLPNQFWRHKNHLLVVEALRIARAARPALAVVCTGNTTDMRSPLYFGELLATIARRGLRDNLLLLGLVPHDDLFQLMRQALALLQPSLFEGWSTSVEEARSLGKRVLASDIPTHREQDPPGARYFSPHNPEQLAGLMVELFDGLTPGPDLALEEAARAQLPGRTRRFGETFLTHLTDMIAR